MHILNQSRDKCQIEYRILDDLQKNILNYFYIFFYIFGNTILSYFSVKFVRLSLRGKKTLTFEN